MVKESYDITKCNNGNLLFRPAEEIKVMIRPWIRFDGVLNRKVLDHMLGAVLGYALLHPGLTMAKMQNRFIPALQPFHTRELAEVCHRYRICNQDILQFLIVLLSLFSLII